MKTPNPITGQTRLTNAPAALLNVRANPYAFGAVPEVSQPDLGGAIARFGAALGQAEERQTAMERTRALADLDTFSTDLDIKMNELQRDTPPDTANYYETAYGVIANETKRFVSDHVPTGLQEEFAARANSVAQNARRKAYDFGISQEDNYFKTRIGEAETRAQNGMMTGGWTRAQSESYLDEIIDNTGLSDIEKEDLRAKTKLGLAKLDYKRSIRTEMEYQGTSAEDIIKGFEGMSNTAYQDHNASDGSPTGYRVGYGSDIVVRADGTIEKVNPTTIVSQADADRTLAYRLQNEFLPRAQEQVGVDAWNQLPQAARGALLSVVWNYGELPDSVVAAVKKGDVNQIAGAVESLDANPKRRALEAEIIRGAVGSYKRLQFADVKMHQRADGLWEAPNIGYELGGTRILPLSKSYVQTVAGVVRAIDPSLNVIITSAAQPTKGMAALTGGSRTGSTRHDVDSHGEGHTADFVLSVGGKRILPGENKELYAHVIEEMAAAGFTGIGHYAWGIHVGRGKPAFWGPSTGAADADPVFKAAYDKGRTRHNAGIDGDPNFALVPYEDRVAMQEDARTQIAREQATAKQEANASREEFINTLKVGVRQGEIGRTEIEDLISSGQITQYSDMSALDEALKKYQDEVGLSARGVEKLSQPNSVWSPASEDDRKMLNAVFGEKGKTAVQNTDQTSFTRDVLPIITTSKDIPTDLVGLLTGLARSPDPKRMAFAYDALAQIRQTAPDAYAARVPDQLRADTEFWFDRKDRMPQEDLARLLTGGSSPQERSQRQQARVEARKLLTEKDGEANLSADALLGNFDSYVSSSPIVGAGWMQYGLVNDYQSLFVDEFERRGDAAGARDAAITRLKGMYGVIEVGGVKQLMKYPPQLAGYKALDGSYDYIGNDVRRSLALPTDSKFFIIPDERTAQEAKAYLLNPGAPLPSYYIWTQDAEGVLAPAKNPAGGAARMRFAPSEKELNASSLKFDIEQQRAKVMRDLNEYNRAAASSEATGTPVPPIFQQELDNSNAKLEELNKRLTEINTPDQPLPEVDPMGNPTGY